MSKEKEKSEIAPLSSGALLSFDEFDNFFNDFLSRKWPRVLDWNFPSGLEKGFPKVDIIDHDKEIEVQAALPGVNKDDLKVTVTGQTLSIQATTSKEEKKKGERFYRREIMRGEFHRTLSLPENVDSDNAKASFKDGLLKVTIPKTEKSQHKNIEVK